MFEKPVSVKSSESFLQIPDIEVSQLEYTFSFSCCLYKSSSRFVRLRFQENKRIPAFVIKVPNDRPPEQTHFMAGNTEFPNNFSGSIRRLSYWRNYRYVFSSLQVFEKPVSVKPSESHLNNNLTMKSRNWNTVSQFLAAGKNLHQE